MIGHVGAVIAHFHTEIALVCQNICFILHGPVGMIIGYQIAVFPGSADEFIDIFTVVLAGTLGTGFYHLFLLLIARVLTIGFVIANDRFIFRVVGKQIQVDLRCEWVVFAGCRGTDISLIAGVIPEIRVKFLYRETEIKL